MDEIAELNRRLEEHSKELMAVSLEYARVSADAARKRSVYDVAKAQAQLKVMVECKDWKVDQQKAEALLRCESQMIDARLAESHRDSLSQRLRSVSASLTAIQSQCRLLKTENDINGYRT